MYSGLPIHVIHYKTINIKETHNDSCEEALCSHTSARFLPFSPASVPFCEGAQDWGLSEDTALAGHESLVPLIQSTQSILSSNFSTVIIAPLIKAQLEVHPNSTDIRQLPAL